MSEDKEGQKKKYFSVKVSLHPAPRGKSLQLLSCAVAP